MIEQDRVVKRGDVYYADLSDRKGSLQKGTRPVVLIPAAAQIMLASAMPQSKWRSG